MIFICKEKNRIARQIKMKRAQELPRLKRDTLRVEEEKRQKGQKIKT